MLTTPTGLCHRAHHDCCCPQPSCLPPQYLALMQTNAKQHHPLPVLATTRQTTGNRFAALAAAGAEPALAPLMPQQPAVAAKKDSRMSLRDFLSQPLRVQPRRQQKRPQQVVGAGASTLGYAQPAQPKVQLQATPAQLGVWVQGPPVRLGSARPACSEQACGNGVVWKPALPSCRAQRPHPQQRSPPCYAKGVAKDVHSHKAGSRATA